jgi:hypothetical protein
MTNFEQELRDDPEPAAQFARFQAAGAARATYDTAMAGNGSDNAFVRWLTRKPLPVKFTVWRALCGLCWLFWTFVCILGTFAAPGAWHVGCFILAVLSGFYDWRIWTRRARRLTLFIIV